MSLGGWEEERVVGGGGGGKWGWVRGGLRVNLPVE